MRPAAGRPRGQPVRTRAALWRDALARAANRVLAAFGVQLVSRSWLAAVRAATEIPELAAPAEEGQDYLRVDNPRLLELRRRYAGHPATAGSRWSAAFVAEQVDLTRFRADNAYVWSRRDAYVSAGADKRRVATHPVNYVLSALYAREHDSAGVLRTGSEDGRFGMPRYAVDPELTASRDLVDSALEIGFLERQLAISRRRRLHVLDVGAGYGRFAHRLVEALPVATVTCIDAVPESTFVSEFYLRYRGVAGRARVLPLDELGELAPGGVDVAVNVHSWSECPLAVINWWVAGLAALEVPVVMVVPNEGEWLLSLEPDGGRRDFAPVLTAHGYTREACEPKYGGWACQRLGVYPTYYHLFTRPQAG